jgi:hypothetical protein
VLTAEAIPPPTITMGAALMVSGISATLPSLMAYRDSVRTSASKQVRSPVWQAAPT